MDKHRSDHSPLAWKVVAGQGPEAEATIGRVSETSWAFTLGVAKLIASFPTEFATGEDVERTGEALFAGIQELWKQHATVPNKTGRSRSWWNQECSVWNKAHRKMCKRDKLVRRLRGLALRCCGPTSAQYKVYDDMNVVTISDIKERAKGLQAAVKRAKRVFFDKIICHAHPQLISNYVAWTRPRRLDSSVQIKRADGTVLDNPEELQEEFKEQFTPSVQKPVDMSILDELPNWEERPFAPIS
ncbi:hypothetical protein FOMPIDRAFT_1136541, partial [Fomitopsis schrenkii]